MVYHDAYIEHNSRQQCKVSTLTDLIRVFAFIRFDFFKSSVRMICANVGVLASRNYDGESATLKVSCKLKPI